MEKRIEQLETMVKRLSRRASKRFMGLITPYPISNSVVGEKVEGTILRYMFPCDGKITKGMMLLSFKPKKWVSVNVKIFNDANSAIRGFTTEKKKITIEPDLEVKAGDCLEIELVPSPDDIVTEVWISFLWIPAMKEVDVKRYLISELESDDLQEEEKLQLTEPK